MSKILLVEDDQNTRNLYKEILENEGHEVDIAEDGQIGLAKILEGGYSLVFLDIMLPKMDGLTVLTSAKRDVPKKPNGKIVILSNLTHDPVIKQAMELGAFDHISKPSLSPVEFVSKTKSLLEAK